MTMASPPQSQTTTLPSETADTLRTLRLALMLAFSHSFLYTVHPASSQRFSMFPLLA